MSGSNAPPPRGDLRAVSAPETRTTAEDVYREFAPAVLGYLRGSGVAEPEDLLGDVFVQVARSIGSFRGDPDGLRRWVFALTRNCMVDERRRRARRPEVEGPDVPDLAVGPDSGPDPHLVAALATLTAEQREVIGLRFVADLPLEDVAGLTGRPVGAVKSMQHRALARLATELGGEVPR